MARDLPKKPRRLEFPWSILMYPDLQKELSTFERRTPKELK